MNNNNNITVVPASTVSVLTWCCSHNQKISITNLQSLEFIDGKAIDHQNGNNGTMSERAESDDATVEESVSEKDQSKIGKSSNDELIIHLVKTTSKNDGNHNVENAAVDNEMKQPPVSNSTDASGGSALHDPATPIGKGPKGNAEQSNEVQQFLLELKKSEPFQDDFVRLEANEYTFEEKGSG